MTSDVQDKVRLTAQLVGPFTLTGRKGEDRTPRGAKTRALAAMLLCAAEGRRTRRWLESRLWSTRQPEQAGASLRQALSELRRTLGDDADALETDRAQVVFRPGCVTTDLIDHPARAREAVARGEEILEGLVIKDPAFDEWLELLRADYAAPPPAPPPAVPGPAAERGGPVVRLMAAETSSPMARMVADYAVERVGLTLSVDYGATVVLGEGGPKDTTMLSIVAVALDHAGGRHLRLAIKTEPLGRLISSQTLSLDPAVDFRQSEELQEAIFIATEKAADEIAKTPTAVAERARVDVLTMKSLDELFTFDAARLRVADGLITAAEAVAPNPGAAAWRAMIKVTMFVEQADADPQGVREQAVALCARALEREPYDSRVLSVAGLVSILSGHDVEFGEACVVTALRQNQGDAIARVGLATALLRAGQAQEALAQANLARRIVRTSRHRHWWEMFCCLAEIAAGDFDAAVKSGEAALAGAPSFRPPMRHLYPLYLHQGRREAARRMLARIRRTEPEFSMEMVRGDPAYPATTMRASGLAGLRDV